MDRGPSILSAPKKPGRSRVCGVGTDESGGWSRGHVYTTCIYCHHDLGSNEAIEEFPVGRRLAFDPSMGRLWVVCRRCERWNLSPFDTRWEAIEACEKRYRDTRLRVSSDNIGLARLPEGLELVRVGAPRRDEFAAWRYGDQFGRRRKRAILYTAAGGTAAGAIVVGGAAAGISMGAIFPSMLNAYRQWYLNRPVDRGWDGHGEPIRILRRHLHTSRLAPSEDGGWELHADFEPGWAKLGNPRRGARRRPSSHHDLRLVRSPGGGWEPDPADVRAFEEGLDDGGLDGENRLIVSGDEALRLASRLMAHANRKGGRPGVIRSAVARIEEAGHPDAFLPIAARLAEEEFHASGKTDLSDRKRRRLSTPIPGSLAGMPDDVRLAVEMATQEQAEREAMQGELKALEAMWRQAEEIAHIADNLFVPESVESFIRRERDAPGGGGDSHA